MSTAERTAEGDRDYDRCREPWSSRSGSRSRATSIGSSWLHDELVSWGASVVAGPPVAIDLSPAPVSRAFSRCFDQRELSPPTPCVFVVNEIPRSLLL